MSLPGELRLGRSPAGLARTIDGMHLHQWLKEYRAIVQENSPAPAQFVSIKTFTTSSITFLPFNYFFRLDQFLFDQPGPQCFHKCINPSGSRLSFIIKHERHTPINGRDDRLFIQRNDRHYCLLEILANLFRLNGDTFIILVHYERHFFNRDAQCQ